MQREKMDFVINKNCNKGGVKEACYIVREYLSNCKKSEDTICTGSHSAVSNQEFLAAVEVLLAFSWSQQMDVIPEMFFCDVDCSRLDTDIFCPGEFQLGKNSESVLQKKLCPHFMDLHGK